MISLYSIKLSNCINKRSTPSNNHLCVLLKCFKKIRRKELSSEINITANIEVFFFQTITYSGSLFGSDCAHW